VAKFLLRALLVLVAVALSVLAWDVWQLRRLRPPEDPTFEGFLRDGRVGSLLLDSSGQRLYWMTSARTVVQYSEPVVYEFGRSGALLNWTPGTGDFKGMILDAPVQRRGTPATVNEARAWLRPAR
jgi:hypothetical protein